MSWRYWEDYPPKRPRIPANGIRAQTQRGKFGTTWWAGRWIAALEELVDPGRLSRGRSYARNGSVLTLDVGKEGVSAKVQGSRPTPYKVSIAFVSLSDDAWEQVTEAMAREALYAAKLLSGEMPAEIETVFAAAGASLLPANEADLMTDCSCPDWANPCKHTAAVHYLLGERFDADPFLMFLLRGRSRDEVSAALRARRPGGVAEGEAEPAYAAEEPEEAPPLNAGPVAFWGVPAEVLNAALSFEAPAVDAVPVKRLGTPPFWRGDQEFVTLMEQAYRAAGARAQRTLLGDEIARPVRAGVEADDDDSTARHDPARPLPHPGRKRPRPLAGRPHRRLRGDDAR